MTPWAVVHLAITALGAIGIVVLVALSVCGAPSVTLLSLLSLATAVVVAIYGNGPLPLLGATVASVIGLCGIAVLWRHGGGLTKAARSLGLMSAVCCMAGGAILIVPRVPITRLSDRIAWASVGLLILWVYCAFWTPKSSGRQASEPEPPLCSGNPQSIFFALDLLSLVISVVWALLCFVGLPCEAIGVVAFMLILGEPALMVVRQLARPGGTPAGGIGWIGLLASFFGWGLVTHELSSPELQAYGWMLLGAGPSAIAWILFARPHIVGEATFLSIVLKPWHRLWQRASTDGQEGGKA